MVAADNFSSEGENKPKKRAGFRSLTFTLAVAFLALNAVVLLIASIMDIYFGLQAQQEIIAYQQNLIAEDAANKVRDFINGKLDMLYASSTIGELAIASREKQEMSLNRLIGLDDSFRQLALLDENGHELLLASRLSGLVSGSFIEYEKDEMLSSVTRGETYISSVYIDEVTSEPMVVMSVPVKNIFGDMMGVLTSEVNLKFMWDLMASIQIGRNGRAYVVDKLGNLLAFGDIGRVLRGENLIRIQEVNDFVNCDSSVHKSSAEVSKGILGNDVVANHAHLVKPDWAVVVELPVEEAYESVAMEIQFSALAMLISFFLAIIAGTYLSKRITKPVISLRDAAAEIGEGNLDEKIKVKTKNEIGQLASAFNKMTSDLKKSKRELEKYSESLEMKVKKRTKELEQKNEELARFNRLAVGRELRMVELKKKIEELEGKLKNK